MTTSLEASQVALPFTTKAPCTTIINTCTEQSALIKKAPLYATTPAVQAVVTDMDTAVATLSGTQGQIVQILAQLRTLERTRGSQIVVVQLKHNAVVTALDTASNNDPEVAAAWVGKTKSRAKPLPVSTSTNPPENPAVRNVKAHPGMVEVSCAKEDSVVCYAFQQGTDPLHPETWPAPAMVKGHTFKVGNLPIGQILCFRVSIVRRGSVQSQWSAVMPITIR
jgi:hypothetical protein